MTPPSASAFCLVPESEYKRKNKPKHDSILLSLEKCFVYLQKSISNRQGVLNYRLLSTCYSNALTIKEKYSGYVPTMCCGK